MASPQESAYTISGAEEGDISVPRRSLPQQGRCRALLSFDYDGTLKHEKYGIEAGFFDTMRHLHKHGVWWGINTGRSLHKLAGELAEFPLMPDFICTCERYVYMADAIGHLAPAAQHNARCHRANLELREKLLPTWLPALHQLRQLPGAVWELAADDPLSIEAIDSETMDILMPHLRPFAKDEVAIQRAGRFMRLSDARFSKGSALRYVQQALGVEESHLVLIGDGHNDIDAFRHFPHAFCAAPNNAHPDVRAWLCEHGGYISPLPGVLDIVRFRLQQIMPEAL